MTASNQDANDNCDPGEPRVTYESLSLGEAQCLEVMKKINPHRTLKPNFTLIHTVISVDAKSQTWSAHRYNYEDCMHKVRKGTRPSGRICGSHQGLQS